MKAVKNIRRGQIVHRNIHLELNDKEFHILMADYGTEILTLETLFRNDCLLSFFRKQLFTEMIRKIHKLETDFINYLFGDL